LVLRPRYDSIDGFATRDPVRASVRTKKKDAIPGGGMASDLFCPRHGRRCGANLRPVSREEERRAISKVG
jgi:hypothetical protein